MGMLEKANATGNSVDIGYAERESEQTSSGLLNVREIEESMKRRNANGGDS
jgi:hypothetical protein